MPGAGHLRAHGTPIHGHKGQFLHPGGFDGPSESPGSLNSLTIPNSPRTPMSPPQQQYVRPGTPNQNPAGPSGQTPLPQGLGYDPSRAPPKPEKVITNTRVELPASAYRLEHAAKQIHAATRFPGRPGLNTSGKQIQIRVNQFKISQVPSRNIYQYDVLVGTGAEKRGLVKAVWECNTVRSRLRSAIQGPWLWNGDKIAWCAFPVPEMHILVDMDAERGRPPHPGRAPNTVRFVIRPAKIVGLNTLHGFLNRQTTFDESCLEAINFLDHLIRQQPSEVYTTIKRSFFAPGGSRHALDNVIEAMRGVYSSIRLCELTPSMGNGPGTGLALNVDVANGTFWTSQDVHQAARNLCKARNRNLSYQVFRDQLLPVKDPKKPGVWTQSNEFKELRKMAKLKFRVKHRGKQNDYKDYVIKKFTFPKDPRDPNLAREGMHAKNTKFTLKQKQAGNITTQEVTVYDYFVQKYNIRLEFWFLPLIETTRDGLFPMELCTIQPNQRFQYKLSPDQTANMIKFAVTRPKERLQAIQHGVGMLKWHQDRYLDHFGLKVDPNLTITQARLLQPPEVQYAGAKSTPGTSGRWDLRGKKFLLSNPTPLVSWGVCVIQSCVNEQVVRNFLSVFINTYISHGGKVTNKNPAIHITGGGDGDLQKAVEDVRQKAGNQSQAIPQILLFVLPGRDSAIYERLKRNNECRFAMVSQMLNVSHVQKAAPQYCSNVCMKLNAKLGGTTSQVVLKPGLKSCFPVKTMIIGVDVSHPSPGSPQPSMAALTMSWDANACRYAAAVQTNGHRVEMLSEANIKQMFIGLFRRWIGKVGGNSGPAHIYYFRDGVSEGQYDHVLNSEVAVMKRLSVETFGPPAAGIKWTVIVCAKRHHIRFFPKDGDSAAADRNNNPLPGTLVERDVTHPFEYDFYLNSHSAIQGTARPVHYHVLMDEANIKVDELQKLIYTQCYQYMRSTTPVSIFPAVYYAHLASNRARAHEAHPASEGPRGGEKFEEALQDAANERNRTGAPGTSQTGSSAPTETLPLLPLGNENMDPALIERIRTGMWYI